jgi:hypothetical protein
MLLLLRWFLGLMVILEIGQLVFLLVATRVVFSGLGFRLRDDVVHCANRRLRDNGRRRRNMLLLLRLSAWRSDLRLVGTD